MPSLVGLTNPARSFIEIRRNGSPCSLTHSSVPSCAAVRHNNNLNIREVGVSREYSANMASSRSLEVIVSRNDNRIHRRLFCSRRAKTVSPLLLSNRASLTLHSGLAARNSVNCPLVDHFQPRYPMLFLTAVCQSSNPLFSAKRNRIVEDNVLTSFRGMGAFSSADN
jgi:hypothetical protein